VSGIEFLDELPGKAAPNSRLHRKQLFEFAEAVKKEPGRWAIYPFPSTDLAARATASRISNGKIAAFKVGFEAVTRRGVVYVRYEGQGQ
jgi:hypothetical protein